MLHKENKPRGLRDTIRYKWVVIACLPGFIRAGLERAAKHRQRQAAATHWYGSATVLDLRVHPGRQTVPRFPERRDASDRRCASPYPPRHDTPSSIRLYSWALLAPKWRLMQVGRVVEANLTQVGRA